MKTVAKVGISLATLIILLWCTGGAALGWTISGTVYGGSTPLADAKVTAYTAADQTPAASGSTDAGGRYSLSVPAGTYNLLIAPPSASGLANSVVNGIAVVDTGVVQNIVLVEGANVLGGTVRTAGGAPASNIRVKIKDQATGTQLADLVTDGNGGYSAPLASGTYQIDVEMAYGRTSGAPVPKNFWIWPLARNVQVSGSASRDLTLPFATLSGKTVDPAGMPVPGVKISVDQYWSDNSSGGYTFKQITTDATSDSSGNYSIVLIAGGTYNLVLTPQTNSGLAITAVSSLAVSGDRSLNLALSAQDLLHGTVRNAAGMPASNVRLKIKDQASGTQAASLVTDLNGTYSITLASGSYSIDVEYVYGVASSVPTPKNYWIWPLVRNVSVAGSTTRDLTLPFATLSGRTVDSAGAPVAGVKLKVDQYWSDSSSGGYTFKQVTTDATSDSSGNYSIVLITGGSYNLALTAPAGSSVANTVLKGIALPADTTRDLVLSDKSQLSGVVRNPAGTPASNVRVKIKDQATGTLVADLVSDSQGMYAAVLAGGSYQIDVEYAYGLTPGVPAPKNFWIWPIAQGIQVAGNTTRDLTLPFVEVRGQTTDANGVPVRGVKLTVDQYWSDTSSGGYTFKQVTTDVTSDGSGRYSLVLIGGGSYSITITPPAGSGFAQTVLGNQKISQDLLQNVILALPDRTAPLILSGPRVSSVTDTGASVEWQTDEPARGAVSYGTGGPSESSVSETEYQGSHVLPLTGLTPGTTYYLQVSASDASGNGPALSQTVSFTTMPTPDTTPPMVLTGPTVSSITHNSAQVEWTTDEPSTGVLEYDLSSQPTQSAADPALATSHRLVLTGLAPETVYYLRAGATDAAGNGPARSALVSFRTLAAPDTSAPVILEGPLAINVTDSGATIIWKTDEPATSGVSWNDGTVYGVLSDETPVTSHSLHVTGLAPSTGYTFTVSSKDPFGNGPTLSTPATFTTPPAPDTKPPVLTLQPTLKNVNHQMALIYWETDEPADSVIEYGTTQALGSTDAHAELITKHNRPLTGLASGTTYYFRVLASDGRGNGPTASQVASFTTDELPSSKAPVVTSAPEVIYASDRAATVYFETDVPCDTVVQYGAGGNLTNSQSRAEKVNKHQATLTNLTPDTAYGVEVSCTGLNGASVSAALGGSTSRLAKAAAAKTSVPTPPASFTTGAQADTTAPVFTVAPTVAALGPFQASIAWSTNEIADSRVSYRAAGQQEGATTGDIAQVFEHSVILTNLSPGTSYQVTVQSVDPSGNSVTGDSLSFTTPVSQDGSCGSANGGSFTVAPMAGLCSAGTPSSVTGTGPWSWGCSGTNGGAPANCGAQTASYPLVLSIMGNGSGSVTSTPSGIAANLSSSASFPFGTALKLHATPAEFSLFMGWGGDCSVNSDGDCALTMSASRYARATFARDVEHFTRIGDSGSYFPTLQQAYAGAPGGSTLKVMAVAFSEELWLDQAKEVRLKGGYNGSYSGNGGFTVLQGSLRIRQGKVAVERLLVRSAAGTTGVTGGSGSGGVSF